MAYPSITLLSDQPTAVGTSIYLKLNTGPVGDFWATFISGLAIIPVHIQGIKNSMVMQMNVGGQAYVFLTKDNSGSITDDTVLFGPAIVEATANSPTFDFAIM